MAYEQHHPHPKQASNHRRNFWPMYNSYGSPHPTSNALTTPNNSQSSINSDHFLPASTFLQELIDSNRKRGSNQGSPAVSNNSMVTGVGGGAGRPLPPPPPPPPPPPLPPPNHQQQQTAAQQPTNQQQAGQQQPINSPPLSNNGGGGGPMADANANLNHDQSQWNFMSQNNGPKLWGGNNGDKNGGSNANSNLEDDFRLEYMVEYMELDEFLTENDIPLESVLQDQPQIDEDPKRQQQQPQQQQQQQQQQSAKQMGPPPMVASPTPQQNGHLPPPPPHMVDSGGGNNTPNESQTQIKTECPSSMGVFDNRGPPSQQQQQMNPGGGQGPGGGGQGPGGGAPNHQAEYGSLPPMSATQPSLYDKKGVISLPPPPPPPPLDADSPTSGSLMRKRKKQMVADERKDERYWERRRKNNMAAKRSRDARRAKETQIAIQANILERENKNLTEELSKARAENLLLKERLQKYEQV